MKRAAVDHPKLQRLQRRLQLTRFQAMGLLEALWHFTGRYAPQGDLGRWSDEEIAAWIEWEGAPEDLIETLVVCGWLDRDPVHRLLVHDWPEHADEATKVSLKRAKKDFAVPTKAATSATHTPVVATVSRPPEPEPEPEPEPCQSQVLTADVAAESAPAGAEPEGFNARKASPIWDEFLLIYPPRNGDRGTAKGRERFLAVLKSGVSPDELLAGVKRYRAWADASQTTGTQFVKQIPTWLSGRCWSEPWQIAPEGQCGASNGRERNSGGQSGRAAGVRQAALREPGPAAKDGATDWKQWVRPS